jgi:hypothetical protein
MASTVALKQRAQPTAVALGQPLCGLEQQMASPVKVRVPAIPMSALASALRSAGCPLALALAPDAVQRGVHAADQVEVIDHDPRPWELVVDRLPVGLVGVDRHDLDGAPVRLGKCLQVPLDHLAAAAIEHLHDPAMVQIGDHGCELVAAAMVCLIQ